MKKNIKEYKVEIIASLVILFGLFLIFERMEIRETLMGLLNKGLDVILNVANSIFGWITGIYTGFTLSDALGILLVISMSILVIWRIRYRFEHSEMWLAVTCPRCGSEIMRIHRSPFDKLLGWIFLPHARRYACTKKDCDWKGLRRKGRRREYQEKFGEFIESD